jgi:hypothetical protein
VEVGATKSTHIEANGSVAAEIASKAPVLAQTETRAHEDIMAFLRDWRREWRSSSATFHDRSKRGRQEVEARIEEKLARQERLLTRIAKAGGISMEEDSPENG